MLIGILAVAAIGYSALAALSGLIVPLVIATVIGMLATPVVDALEKRGVPRGIGALVVMLGIVAAIAGSIVLTVNGVIDEGDEISRFLIAGIENIDSWLEGLDIDIGVADARVEQARQFGLDLIPGLASWFTSAFSSAISFAVGGFVGIFLLYYILADWTTLRRWVGGHLGVAADVGERIVDDATSVIRQGFAVLTLSSVATALLIGATMLVLGLPLAVTVGLVTFLTSYIPYLGAILSATFACLVALGSGSTTQALVLLVVILVAQNLVQMVMSTRLASDRLSLHPIASLISTIVGA
ncbi:MAG: AI-2E family transporter, partial [Acidimicrobiia bacterium]|nr:AI-2E family transporter [Acidimicrobiia bacterium]